MPQIGWLEILAIVIISILVLGPKEFPMALKKLGSYFGKIKSTISSFQREVSSATNDIDFEKISSETMVSKLVLATIQDLVEWKEKVFIAQDAKDVYYINDPILNSFVQLQDLLS